MNNHDPKQTVFIITLKPLPNDRLKRSPEARLRAFLKCALRAWALRATKLTVEKGDDR